MRLLHLCCLLLSTSFCFAMSQEEARQALEAKLALEGCKNKQLCCSICIETLPCIQVCTGNSDAPVKQHVGECKSSYSVIGSALRMRHYAFDYRAPLAEAGGCAPCGSATGAAASSLIDLSLMRVQFQDTDVRTSLGTKSGFQWDIWLHCFPPGSIASGHPTGQPGWQIQVSQPQAQPLDFLVLTDPDGDGTFRPEQGYENRGLVFRDAAGQVVADPRMASSATLALFDGGRMEFEVYVETDASQPLGRLTRFVDRNGNAVVSTWKYAVDGPDMTGSMRSKLAIRDSLSDARGRRIVFHYDEARQYSGCWVTTAIDLPDGSRLNYEYARQANVWLGTEERLSRVIHPDGSVSTFDGVSDPTVPGMKWVVADPAADPISRNKTVWFSQGTWVNPANPTQKKGQIFGRAVQIADGNGDIDFLAWFGNFAKPDGGSESRTYTWSRGRLTAFVHEDGWKPGASYVWEGAPGVGPINNDWAGWRKIQEKTYGASTLAARTTTPEGYAVTYERDPASQRVLRATYHDGTVECWERNALGEVTLHRDRLGRLTETTYDAVGNRLAVQRGEIAADPDHLDVRTAPDGVARETWEYLGVGETGLPGQLKAHIDANGNRTDYVYYANGDLRSVVQPADEAGGVRASDQRFYDAAGRLTERRDERGIPTRFTYDANGRLTATTYADGSTETVTYAVGGPAAGLEVERKDRNGNRTGTSYDTAGRRLASVRVDAGGATIARQAWTWVPGTQQVAGETVDGELTTYGYDSEMRRTTTTRQVGGGSALTETQVYVGDRHVATIDAYGRRTLLVRDAEERVVRMVRERLPGAVPAGADPAALPRLGGADPAYVIEDTEFDAAGQVVARRDGNGVRSVFGYDALGRLAAQTEAADLMPATTGFGYDPAGNRIRVTSPRGVVTTMAYTGRNLLRRVTEAAGSAEQTVVREMTYTVTRKVATERDANGNLTTFLYGGCCDRLRQIVDGGEFITDIVYDFNGNRIKVTDGNQLTTTWSYDGRNRVVRVANALGDAETTQTVYDDDLTDGVGLDADGGLIALLPGLGFAAGIADGSAVSVIDPTGARRIQVSDGVGRTVLVLDALNHATRYTHDLMQADGTVAMRRIDALSHATLACTDGLGRTVRTVDAVGQETLAGFDANGNQLSQATTVAGEAIGWSSGYDGRNRLLFRSDTRLTDPGTTSWSYDLDGNRVGETDAAGKTEASRFDLRNRRVALLDRVGGTTRFGYDPVGNLVSISDAENELRTGSARANGLTQYAYDARNLLIAEAFPIGQRGRTLRRYAYDAGRRLVSRRVGQLSGAFSASAAFTTATPETTSYGYDAANRLVRRGYGDGQADDFVYDRAGRLTLASSSRYGNDVLRTYDPEGQLLSEQLSIAGGIGLLGRVLLPAQYTVRYGYDADHRVTTITYPDGRTVTRTYTARDQLELVRLDGAAVTRRGYDPAGRLVEAVSGNGVVETRRHVAGDHLVESIAAVSPMGGAVTGFSYTHDADRRKLSEADVVGAGQSFGYDAAGRLTSWQQGTQAQTWNLSLVGDWASTTRNGVVEPRRHTSVHEVTRVGGVGLSYDAKGNLTRDDLGQTLVWDPENRLREARGLDDSDPNRAAYAYDALGRRISKTVDGLRTDYANAGAQAVQTYGLRATARPSEVSSDGSTSSLSQTPAGGGLLPAVAGKQTVRVNFQPSYEPIPSGYIADKGRLLTRRTNGRTYGWTGERAGAALVRGMVADAAYDTLIPLGGQQWRMALANGSYTVAVVAGDAAATDSVNDLVVNGIALHDPENPPPNQPGYARGDFDGWAVQVTVTDGYLTISAGAGAVSPRLCFVEIGPKGVMHDLPAVGATVAARVQAMTDATAVGNPDRAAGRTPRTYVFGSYVDEVLAYVTGSGAQAKKYYPHYNHLYSIAALTDHSGSVVERYSYTAFGAQTITGPTGVVRAKSAVGFDRGFTGYIADNETGLLHARARQYSPTLGRFIRRDGFTNAIKGNIWYPMSGMGYHDGISLYRAYFVPGSLDPSGLEEIPPERINEIRALICAGMQGRDAKYENGLRLFDDGKGGLVGGGTVTDNNTNKVDLGGSKPPPGAGGEVGNIHNHTSGHGPSRGDFDGVWRDGWRYNVVVNKKSDCCGPSKDGTEWEAQIDYFATGEKQSMKNKMIPIMREHGMPTNVAGEKPEDTQKLIDATREALKSANILLDSKTIRVCCKDGKPVG